MPELITSLDISALTHGGRGIGRHNGKAVFVPLTAPEDRVSCRVLREKKSYIEAELLDVIRSSNSRRNAPCPFFGSCGGCQWQHLPYEFQLQWKERIFSDLLTRNSVVSKDVVQPIVPSDEEWRYRNRVQFKCHSSSAGLNIGFYRRGSHHVIDVDPCLLLSPPIQGVYNILREELPGCPAPKAISQVDIAAGDNGDVRTVVHVLSSARRAIRPWLKTFGERNNLQLCLQYGRKESLEHIHGESTLSVSVDDPEIQLKYSPGGFAQVNSGQNRRMVSEMLAWLDLKGDEKVLDLFCGMGNFSLPLARRVKSVVGVEAYASSIENARLNAGANYIDNVDFHIEDAVTHVERYQPGDFDIIVLDPPRAGHYKVVQKVLSLFPRQVLYVSCDPATLARDIKPMVQNGYEVIKTRPFDLFPQTWHVESMTLLQRL